MADPENLTEARIRAKLKAAAPGAELRLHDARVPGLLLWRRPNGKARWYVFKRIKGRIKRLPVGEVSDLDSIPLETARDLARALIGRLAANVDVVGERRMERAKVAQHKAGGAAPLADALKLHLGKLDERKRDARHVAELKRVVTDAVANGVVDLAAPGIVKKAREWLDELNLSEQTRARYRRHLLAVTRTALAEWPPEILPRDPFMGLRGKGAAMPVPAVFTPAEAMTLVSDKALALPGGRLFAFLLMSGCRFREATWARWDRVNLTRETFDVVPPSASEYAMGARVKRMKPRTVKLPTELVGLLNRWKDEATEDDHFLIPAIWRTQSHVASVFAFRDHLAALAIPLADEDGRGRKIHSLRHTRQTIGIAAGEDSLRLRLSMGHAGEDMGAHYGRLAMRWRGLLGSWDGEMHLRQPSEVKRISAALDKTINRPAKIRTVIA